MAPLRAGGTPIQLQETETAAGAWTNKKTRQVGDPPDTPLHCLAGRTGGILKANYLTSQ